MTSVKRLRKPLSVDAGLSGAAEPAAKPEGRRCLRISPVARKMAEEHMIDITRIAGTGPEGRIVKEDVEKAIAAKDSAPPAEPQA